MSIAPLSGGLVGVLVPDALIQDATRDSAGVVVPWPGHKRIVSDASYEWFPAVAASLVFRFVPDAVKDKEDPLAFGVGAHFVVYQVRGEDGKRTSPALTLHYGTEQRQAFVGILFTQRGDVRLPGGRQEIVVRDGLEHAFDETRSSSRGGANFYAGVVLGSLSLAK